MKLEKEIDSAARWYDDACGTALALELIGERWSLLIVRELMFGGRRFGELRRSLPGISANVMTQRLDGLAGAGILARRMLPPPAAVRVYELTPWGYEAEPAIQALGRWAVRSPLHDPTLPLSAASLMLSFRTMIDPARAGQRPMTAAFRLGAEGFVATIGADGIAVRRAEPADEDARFTADPMTMAAIVYGALPIADAVRGGMLKVEGDQALAARFVTLFPLPAKVGG